MSEALTLDTITHDQAAANIEAFAREKRLVQGEWHGHRGGGGGDNGGLGQEFACLLGSIHPSIDGTSKCPAHLMPRWMANVTVRLFDGIPEDRIFEYGEAYARRLHRWSMFDDAAWERVRVTFITHVFGGVFERAEAQIGDHPSPLWAEIKPVGDQLLALLLNPKSTWSQYYALRDTASKLRARAWAEWRAARQRRGAVAAAAAAAATPSRSTPSSV